MNANELADKLMSSLTMEYDCDVYMEQAATMLRQQQAEIDKWKFDAQTSNEAIVLLNERIASYLKSSLDDATVLRQQQAEIKRLIGAEPITYGMLTVCKNCGQQNPYFEKAQEK